jgi:hypothetical protein
MENMVLAPSADEIKKTMKTAYDEWGRSLQTLALPVEFLISTSSGTNRGIP